VQKGDARVSIQNEPEIELRRPSREQESEALYLLAAANLKFLKAVQRDALRGLDDIDPGSMLRFAGWVAQYKGQTWFSAVDIETGIHYSCWLAWKDGVRDNDILTMESLDELRSETKYQPPTYDEAVRWDTMYSIRTDGYGHIAVLNQDSGELISYEQPGWQGEEALQADILQTLKRLMGTQG
jgi:hypothetical protein